jgi:protein TonB
MGNVVTHPWRREALPEQGKYLLLLAVGLSVFLHTSGLYAAVRWGGCICNISKVVCPKICSDPMPRINIELAQVKPPPPPRAEPRPAVVVQQPRNDRPAPAPKAGKVVLPDEAFKPVAPRRAEARLNSPALPKEVVVKSSDATGPVIVSAEIFSRADSLQPESKGSYGLGGTGSATSGPFGVAKEGDGTSTTQPLPAPKVEPPTKPDPKPEPPPTPRPRGATQPPRVLDWTDPPYPSQARQQGVEGTVKLRVMVSSDGHAENVRVVQSSGNSVLDDAAVSHVRQARFSPALRNGVPVAMTIAFRVRFRLVTG